MTTTSFAPQLFINNGVTDISFYEKAFNAVTHFCLTNDDGGIHVAEMDIDGAIFYVHEVSQAYMQSPAHSRVTTVEIALFTEDVHAVMDQAIAAGATLFTPVTDYDYGYRQGQLIDPFGHHWTIQKKL